MSAKIIFFPVFDYARFISLYRGKKFNLLIDRTIIEWGSYNKIIKHGLLVLQYLLIRDEIC